MRALEKRDKMCRAEIIDLRKKVNKLSNLLRKKEREIRDLKREAEFYGSGGETIGIDGVFAAIY